MGLATRLDWGRWLTLAARSPASAPLSASPFTGDFSGLRFSYLGSPDGSEAEGESIPTDVAMRAPVEEVRVEVGWTPVLRRRKKTAAEQVNDFLLEIGYPTTLSRHWEKGRRASASPGESMPLFCRSIDVYATEDGTCNPTEVSPAGFSPPSGTICRGATSSPSGLRLSRGPRVKPWRGPLPRRRMTPPPVLGQFLDQAAVAASAPSPASGGLGLASSSRHASILPMIVGEERFQTVVGVTVGPDGSHLHATNPVQVQAWDHLRRRYRRLWDRNPRPVLIECPAAAPTAPRSSSSLCASSTNIISPLGSASQSSWPSDQSRSRPTAFDRSFAAVVTTPTMSGPPQRPPPVGSYSTGHVRPPPRLPALQRPAPGLQLGGPLGMGVGQAGSASAPPGSMPLQPPAGQLGMPTFFPPQQMPYAQFAPSFQQFQALPFQLYVQQGTQFVQGPSGSASDATSDCHADAAGGDRGCPP
jgi:hypothetical protein